MKDQIQIEKEGDGVQERLDSLENRMDLVEMIIKKTMTETKEEEQEKTIKVIQINAGGRKYFCTTISQERIFAENNPGVETETFHLELPSHIAQSYFDDPENAKQFKQLKETVKV